MSSTSTDIRHLNLGRLSGRLDHAQRGFVCAASFLEGETRAEQVLQNLPARLHPECAGVFTACDKHRKIIQSRLDMMHELLNSHPHEAGVTDPQSRRLKSTAFLHRHH